MPDNMKSSQSADIVIETPLWGKFVIGGTYLLLWISLVLDGIGKFLDYSVAINWFIALAMLVLAPYVVLLNILDRTIMSDSEFIHRSFLGRVRRLRYSMATKLRITKHGDVHIQFYDGQVLKIWTGENKLVSTIRFLRRKLDPECFAELNYHGL